MEGWCEVVSESRATTRHSALPEVCPRWSSAEFGKQDGEHGGYSVTSIVCRNNTCVSVPQHRPVGLSLVEYSKSLPLAGDTDPEIGYNLVELAGDLLSHARANFTSNGVVVPVLQTFNVLLEADALRRLQEDSHGETRFVAWGSIWSLPSFCLLCSLQDLLSIVTKNVARLKSIQRILESMKM